MIIKTDTQSETCSTLESEILAGCTLFHCDFWIRRERRLYCAQLYPDWCSRLGVRENERGLGNQLLEPNETSAWIWLQYFLTKVEGIILQTYKDYFQIQVLIVNKLGKKWTSVEERERKGIFCIHHTTGPIFTICDTIS